MEEEGFGHLQALSDPEWPSDVDESLIKAPQQKQRASQKQAPASRKSKSKAKSPPPQRKSGKQSSSTSNGSKNKRSSQDNMSGNGVSTGDVQLEEGRRVMHH